MSVYRVIDKLEATVKQGTVLPFGARIVSEEKLLELIEKLRSSLPEEVGRARTIAKNGDRLVREAQEKAQAIVAEASSHSVLTVGISILMALYAVALVTLGAFTRTAMNRVLQHLPCAASVAADNHPPAPHIRPKCLAESVGKGWRQKLSHDSANTGNANLQQVFTGHQARLLTWSRRASKSAAGGSPRCSQITRMIGSVWLTRT